MHQPCEGIVVYLFLLPLFPSPADFDMSVTQPKSAVSEGQNITLTCQVNVPLTDVTLRWTMAGKNSKKRLLGHLHPHRGVSEVKLSNIGPKDYGIYSCVATYTMGDRVVIDMKAAVLKDGKLFEDCSCHSVFYIMLGIAN